MTLAEKIHEFRMGAHEPAINKEKSESKTMLPLEDFDRLVEGFFGRGLTRPTLYNWPGFHSSFETKFPKVDVVDRENEIIVRAELPGVDKKDIEVSTSDNTVTIRGTIRKEEKDEEGEYCCSEIYSGSISRTVGLPGEVDASGAKATYKDGVLEMVLPKREASVRRNIDID